MQIESRALMTILGMALMTYLTRTGGIWLIRQVRLTPRLEAWLRHLPGTILISIIAPLALKDGLTSVLATLVTILVAIRTKNLLLAILTGVGAVWFLRLLF